jgi:hypothetical protein
MSLTAVVGKGIEVSDVEGWFHHQKHCRQAKCTLELSLQAIQTSPQGFPVESEQLCFFGYQKLGNAGGMIQEFLERDDSKQYQCLEPEGRPAVAQTSFELPDGGHVTVQKATFQIWRAESKIDNHGPFGDTSTSDWTSKPWVMECTSGKHVKCK